MIKRQLLGDRDASITHFIGAPISLWTGRPAPALLAEMRVDHRAGFVGRENNLRIRGERQMGRGESADARQRAAATRTLADLRTAAQQAAAAAGAGRPGASRKSIASAAGGVDSL